MDETTNDQAAAPMGGDDTQAAPVAAPAEEAPATTEGEAAPEVTPEAPAEGGEEATA